MLTLSWTDERVERLKTLWSEGLSASQIANELGGVTRNAVIGKVHRMGLSGRSKMTPQPSRQRSKSAGRGNAIGGGIGGGNNGPRGGASVGVTVGNTVFLAEAVEELAVEARPTPLADIGAERVGIMQLTESMCKWPIGDPGRSDFYFCGRKSDPGIPYCTYHARIAYQPSQDRSRSRKAG